MDKSKYKVNFSASSPVMPKEVINRINKNIINYKDSGFSALEINYKNDLFFSLMEDIKSLLRKLLNLNEDYDSIFLSGGASMHFAMAPLNYSKEDEIVSIINSDLWTNNAVVEGEKHSIVNEINLINTTSPLPNIDNNILNGKEKYLFMCTNNTSSGSRFSNEKICDNLSVPLIADMTSNLLSEVYDINKFSLLFSSAAKNMGTSGVSLVIAKKDILNIKPRDNTPKILSYNDYYSSGSSFTTPNTFAMYTIYEMLKYLDEIGGVEKQEEINREKANLLYNYIDDSHYYENDITKEDRSITSITFKTKDAKDFIKNANLNNIINISTSMQNDVRIGLYNGVSVEDVKKLIKFMHSYEKIVK